MKKNLFDIYYDVQETVGKLAAYDEYSFYQERINELKTALKDLYNYFGIKRLKRDFKEFKKGEMVIIQQDEGGVWIAPLDYNDNRYADLCGIHDEGELFYEF